MTKPFPEVIIIKNKPLIVQFLRTSFFVFIMGIKGAKIQLFLDERHIFLMNDIFCEKSVIFS